MHITAGLVGLPNVGKSTLFNALTKSCAPAENYPFCTINPHIACTLVPDQRCHDLQKIYSADTILFTTIQFVDIAGLVKGAASGEGLGNQFLSHIRAANLILHTVRCFDDPDIVRIGEINPVEDLDIIITELMLKDIESIRKRKAKIATLIKSARNKPQESATLEREEKVLEIAERAINDNNYTLLQTLHNHPDLPRDLLLSSKPFAIVANCAEGEDSPEAAMHNPYLKTLQHKYGPEKVIPVSAKLAYELSLLTDAEAAEVASLMGITHQPLPLLINKVYTLLGLITFFTCGPKEIHAWSIPKDTPVRAAAAAIHSDLERGFICADVWSYLDLKQAGSEAALKSSGKMRTEGQDYKVQDGDILLIKHNT